VGCSEIGSSGGVRADDERPPGSPVGVRVEDDSLISYF
jgi:hypothetical protein